MLNAMVFVDGLWTFVDSGVYSRKPRPAWLSANGRHVDAYAEILLIDEKSYLSVYKSTNRCRPRRSWLRAVDAVCLQTSTVSTNSPD